jgi:putative membrane protein
MRGFVGRLIINLLLLAFVAWVVQGIQIHGFFALMFAGIILALLNAFVRPLLILITLPLSILTVGLFVFIVNGFIFWLGAHIVKGFDVSGFWTAVWGAFIYSVASLIVNMLLSDRGRIEIIHFRR